MSDMLSSTLAGVAASIAEPAITYPLEYLKVREQLALRPQSVTEKFSIPEYTKICYSGSSAFILGNAVKAMARFQTYNWAAKFMAEGGTNSAPQVVVAGIITGIAESLLVVPFENIKTSMIESSSLGRGAATGVLPVPGSRESLSMLAGQALRKGTNSSSHAHASASAHGHSSAHAHAHGRGSASAHSSARKTRPAATRPAPTHAPLYNVYELKGLRANVAHMYEQRGLRAFVQGFTPTMIRQVANSSVRFTSYNFLKQMVVPDGPVGLGVGMALAGASSLIEAVVTQPIDVVKTRMQSTNGIRLYGNAMVCSLRIFFEEGPKRLWAGLLPRWLRIWSSGGIMFVVYEQTQQLIRHEQRQKTFE